MFTCKKEFKSLFNNENTFIASYYIPILSTEYVCISISTDQNIRTYHV